MQPLIEVRSLTLQRNQHIVLENISFHLKRDDCLCLSGPIGAGKSTLLQGLLGFVPFTHGEIILCGRNCRKDVDFSQFRGTIGLLFQHPDDQLFGPTVLEDVAFGPLNQGMSKAQANQTALRQLQRLDIAHLAASSVNMLSGGEKTFVALAGILAMQPQILLLDEPTNGLDQANIERLTALLQQLNLPMIIATHQVDLISALATQVLDLNKPTSPPISSITRQFR